MSPLELVLFGALRYLLGLVSDVVLIPWLVGRGLFPIRRHDRALGQSERMDTVADRERASVPRPAPSPLTVDEGRLPTPRGHERDHDAEPAAVPS